MATCNPGGAGKWRPEHAETLREADVVVVADRDDVGYRHARDVVKSLEGIAIRVRLAEPATGKDVSDHLSAGLDLAALVMLGNEGPVAQLAPDIYAFLATGEEEYDWLVEGLLERGDRLLLTGFRGARENDAYAPAGRFDGRGAASVSTPADHSAPGSHDSLRERSAFYPA